MLLVCMECLEVSLHVGAVDLRGGSCETRDTGECDGGSECMDARYTNAVTLNLYSSYMWALNLVASGHPFTQFQMS